MLEVSDQSTNQGGGLALFLFGMREMTESLKTMAGSSMISVFSRMTTNRDHEQHGCVEEQLEAITNATFKRAGNLVIPVFAVECAQEMMYFISRVVYKNRIPKVSVFLDSPMAYDVTNLFRRVSCWLDGDNDNDIEQFKVIDDPREIAGWLDQTVG